MNDVVPSSASDVHRAFLRSCLFALRGDERIVGVAATGSFLTNSLDEFSDLDLLIASEARDHGDVMADRVRIAGALGPLLSAFTGEHVGEPRLLICLYDGASPLHVDLKFVALDDLAERVEEPAVLWERDGRLTRALEVGKAEYPAPDLQWIEDRFWVWIHYAAAKAGRGEIFEVLDFLSFLRTRVLGPLALAASGARPAGVRRLESLAPTYVHRLEATVATHSPVDCLRALRACIELYRPFRAGGALVDCRDAAEAAAVRYLSDVERRGGPTQR